MELFREVHPEFILASIENKKYLEKIPYKNLNYAKP